MLFCYHGDLTLEAQYFFWVTRNFMKIYSIPILLPSLVNTYQRDKQRKCSLKSAENKKSNFTSV